MSGAAKVERVTAWICEMCLDGHAGICSTPGCAFIRMKGPEWAIRDNVESAEKLYEQAAESMQRRAAEHLDSCADGPEQGITRRTGDLCRNLAECVRALPLIDEDEIAGFEFVEVAS